MRGWENIFHANRQESRSCNTPIRQDRHYKEGHKERQGHFLIIKEAIQKEDITIINIYVPNIGPPRYTQQILTDIKGEIDGNTVIET